MKITYLIAAGDRHLFCMANAAVAEKPSSCYMGEVAMKKEKNSTAERSKVLRMGPADSSAGPAASPATASRPAAARTPVWTRYVDSRLKQFCSR